MAEPDSEKWCASCGRRIAWRRRWAASWEQIRYCSARCRRARPGRLDRELEATLRELLAARPRGASVCPSEVARAVRPEAWRELMERTRSAARRLVAAGEVEICQGGRAVDPSTARGPVRVRRVRS